MENKKKLPSKIKALLCILLSFVLALTLFALSYCLALEVTVFNSDYIINNMNSSVYFTDKRDEITEELISLGYASGLDEDFFDGLLDEVMLHEDTESYLEDFYSGEGSAVDTTSFKQRFNEALDGYIEENEIDPDSVESDSREYLIKQAAKIYANSLSIPLLSTVAGTFLGIRKAAPIALAVLSALTVMICLILIFSQKWRHRSARYICYATSGAFLATVAVPAFMLVTNKLSQINLSSRAFYNLFVACGNNIFYAVLFIGIFYLVVSVGLYFLYKSLYNKASG